MPRVLPALTASLLVSASTWAGVQGYISPVSLAARSRHMNLMRGTAPRGLTLPPDQYYNQTLDHFDVLNTGFWPQRYWYVPHTSRAVDVSALPPLPPPPPTVLTRAG